VRRRYLVSRDVLGNTAEGETNLRQMMRTK
jgi:hypothetical protein